MASEEETIDASKKLEHGSIEVKDGENGTKNKEDEGRVGKTEVDGSKKEAREEEKNEEESAGNGSEEQKVEEDRDEEQEEGSAEDETDENESKEEKGGEIGGLSSPRPTRERKTVDRFTVTATPKGSASKPLAIEKGRGTQLKDIPNVAFKLSKRKADENLQQLHHILFGKKAKAQTLKRHLGLVSGFVWAESEQEKQRAKAKERIDKCVKEKLLDFCDVLNIPVNKTTVKKEELSSKLLEFLESPYATTPNLLADKEKGKKRLSKDSSKSPGSNASSGKSTKKQRKGSEFEKKQKPSDDEESGQEMEPSKSGDDQDDDITGRRSESDQEKKDSEKESDGDQDKSGKKIVEKKGSSKKTQKKDASSMKKAAKKDTAESSGKSKSIGKGSSKSAKNTSDSASKKRPAEIELKGEAKTPPAKKQKAEKETEKPASSPSKGLTSSKKKSSKSSTKVGEGQKAKKTKEPTREEMHAAVADILKEVDFNTATLSDILRQLGEHFKADLISRKSEIKDIITDVINNMSDDEDDENEPGETSGKDGDEDDE